MEFLVEKEHWYKSGIYIITNEVNGKVYIGRTNNFWRRYHQYKYSFNTGKIKHINQHFLNSMNKYGFENFSFRIVTKCTQKEALELELLYMYLFESYDKTKGYNKRLDTDGGMIVSKETSNKISNRLKKEWATGVRSQHSEKLKESWKSRDRAAQGEQFSKYLTKYYYVINDNHDEPLTYKDLQERGYRNCICSFHRTKRDRVKYKDVIIERFKIKRS